MKKDTFVQKVRALGTFFVFFGIFFTFTCDNSPFVAGLGPKVDILAPVIHEILPLSGDYLKDNLFRFQAKVTDDIEVKKVELWYQYNKTNDKKTGWKVLEMKPMAGKEDWWETSIDSGILEYKEAKRKGNIGFSKDTWIDRKPINDNGPFYIYIKAYDEEAERSPEKRPPTESDPNSYKIKLGPPVIALNSPNLSEEFWLTTDRTPDNSGYVWDKGKGASKPVVYVRSDLLGTVNDVQGVKAQYPEIKFWDISKGQTEDTAKWMKFDEYNIEDWGTRTEPPGLGGSEFIRFKLSMFERDPVTGKLPREEERIPLPQGDTYRFRIRASDIGETGTGAKQQVSHFPEIGFPPGQICIEASEGPAVIDFFLDRATKAPPYNAANSPFDPYVDGNDFINVPPNRDIHRIENVDDPYRDAYGQITKANEYITVHKPFVFEARASHSKGIKRADLVVTNLTSKEIVYLEWHAYLNTPYNTADANPNEDSDPRWIESRGTKRRQFLFMSPVISMVPMNAAETEWQSISLDAYTLTDNAVNRDPIKTSRKFQFKGNTEYEITLRVWENAVEDRIFKKGIWQDNFDVCSQKPFTIRILDTPPVIKITQLRNSELKSSDEIAKINVTENGKKVDKTLYQVNGVFDFNALITDDYGVEESRWWLVKNSNGPNYTSSAPTPDWKAPFVKASEIDGINVFAAGNGRTELKKPDTEIDVRGGSTFNKGTGEFNGTAIPNGTYTLYVMAQGRAEVPATETVYISVKQEADIPEMKISEPLNGSVVRELLAVRGTLEDDDGIGIYTIYNNEEKLSDGNVNTAIAENSASWKQVAQKKYTGDDISTRKDLYELLNNVTLLQEGEGTRQLKIVMEDAPSVKLGKDKDRTAVQYWDKDTTFTSKIVTFTRDTTPPKITVTKKFDPALPGDLTIESNVPALAGSEDLIFSTPASFNLQGLVKELFLDTYKDPGKIPPTQPLFIKWDMTINDNASNNTREGFITATPVSGHGTSRPYYTWEMTNGTGDNHLNFNEVDDGRRTIVFYAVDQAGNKNSTSITITKDNTPPEVTFTNTNKSITDTDAYLRGSFYDKLSDIGYKKISTSDLDYAQYTGHADEYFYEYRIYRYTGSDTAPAPSEAETPFVKGLFETNPKNPGQSANWNISLTGASNRNKIFWDDLGEIPDGTWWLEIYVADRLNNGVVYGENSTSFNITDAAKFKHTRVKFVVDRVKPLLAITKEPDGFYGPKTATPVSPFITGTVTDGDFKELIITIDNKGGSPATITGTVTVSQCGAYEVKPDGITYSWSWDLSSANWNSLIDGDHLVTVTSYDYGNPSRTDKWTFTFTKDTQPPKVTLNNVNKQVIDKDLWAKPATDKDKVDALNGNNERADKDKYPGITRFTEQSPVIRGTIEDTNLVSPIGFETDGSGKYYFSYSIYSADKLSAKGTAADVYADKQYPFENGTLKSQNFAITLDETNYPDGMYWLDITVKDRIGNVNDGTGANAAIGILNVAFTVDRYAPTIEITGVPASTQESSPGVPATTGKPDSTKLSANDTHNNAWKDAFTLKGTASDRNLRGLKIKVDNEPEVVLDYDSANTAKVWNETNTSGAGAALSPVGPSGANNLVYTWTWDLNNGITISTPTGTLLAFSNAGLGQGQHTLTITAYDFAGKTASVSYDFVKDTEAPKVAYGNIQTNGSTVLKDNYPELRGSFNDLYSRLGFGKESLPKIAGGGSASQYYFEYRIGNSGDHAASTWYTSSHSIDWIKSPLETDDLISSNWTIPLTRYKADGTTVNPTYFDTFWPDLEEIPDGKWYLEIRVTDRVGNQVTMAGSSRVDFYVDRKNPAINVTGDDKIIKQLPDYPIPIYGPETKGFAADKEVITLTGTVTDGDLKNLVIRVTPKNGAAFPALGKTFTAIDPVSTTSWDAKKLEECIYSWTWTLKYSDFNTILSQGENTITVIATDDKDRTDVKQYSFVKDTAPPKVDFTNINRIQITPEQWKNGTVPGSQTPEAFAAAKAELETKLTSTDDTKRITLLPGSTIQGTFTDVTSFIGHEKVTETGITNQYYFEYRIYGRTDLLDAGYESNVSKWRKLPITKDALEFAWTIDVSGLSDGMYWLDIRVADRIGNSTDDDPIGAAAPTKVRNIAFTIDRSPPEIAISGVYVPGDSTSDYPASYDGAKPFGERFNAFTADTLKETFTLKGTAKDGNLRGLKVLVETKSQITDNFVKNNADDSLDTDASTNVWESYIPTPTATYGWQWKFNDIFTAGAGSLIDGTWTITITAYDFANKEKSVEFKFTKDTAKPVVTLDGILLAGTSQITDGANPRIRLSINDDTSKLGRDKMGSVGTENYFFKYKIYRADPAASVTEKQFPIGSIAAVGKSVSPNISLLGASAGFWPTSDAIPDGTYWLEIEVSDRVGNVQNQISEGGSQASRVQFIVNRNPPDVRTSSKPDAIYKPQGTGTGEVFTLRGTVRDGDLVSLKISLKNDRTGDTPEEIKTYTVKTSGTQDWDNYPAVEWLPGIPNNLTYDWSWTLSKDDFTTRMVGDENYITEGTNTIIVVATDAFTGNTVTKEYTFVKDTVGPEVEFQNIKKWQVPQSVWGLAPTAQARIDALDGIIDNALPNAALEIKGIFTDHDSRISFPNSAPWTFKYRIYKADKLALGTANDKGDTVVPDGQVGWATYTFADEPGLSQNFTIPLTKYKADGVTLTERYNPQFWNNLDAIPDGLYWLDIFVADRIDNQTYVYNVAFTVDRKPPEVEITSPDPKADKNKPFNGSITLKGTAEDPNLRGVSIRVDENDEISFDYITAGAVGSTGFTWVKVTGDVYDWQWVFDPTKAITLPNGTTVNYNLADGTHTVTVTAIDFAGKTKYAQYIFIKDTTAPVITLNNLEDAETVITETNAKIQVYISDEHSKIGNTFQSNGSADNRFFEYRIYPRVDDDNDAFPPDSGATAFIRGLLGDDLSVGKSVNHNIFLTSAGHGGGGFNPNTFWNSLAEIPDGKWWIEVRVVDRLGNATAKIGPAGAGTEGDAAEASKTIDRKKFYVDRKKPVLTASDLKDPPIYGPETLTMDSGDTVFNLHGTVTDGDFTNLKIELRSGNTLTGTLKNTWNLPASGLAKANVTAAQAAATPAYDGDIGGVRYTWTWNITKQDFDDYVAQGPNTLTVIATDFIGNVNTPAVTYAFTLDTAKPRVEFSNIKPLIVIDQDMATSTVPSVIDEKNDRLTKLTRFEDEAPVIRGTFIDAHSSIGYRNLPADAGDTRYYFEYRIYTEDQLKAGTYPAAPAYKKQYWNDEPSGTQNFTIDLTGSNPPFWTSDADENKIPDGTYWLDIKVADRINNPNTANDLAADPQNIVQNIVFTVDRKPPQLELDPFANDGVSAKNKTHKEAFTLTGTATDRNLWYLKIQVVRNDTGAVVVDAATEKYEVPAANATYPVTSGKFKWLTYTSSQIYTWSWDISSYFNPDTFLEGAYTITVTAYDKANRTDSKQYAFTKDVHGPVVTLNNSVEADGSIKITDDNAMLRLAFNDAYSRIGDYYYDAGAAEGQRDKVYNFFKYSISRVGTSKGLAQQNFASANPAMSANFDVLLKGNAITADFWPATDLVIDGIPDGDYVLKILVYDRTGNFTDKITHNGAEVSELPFTVSRKSPKFFMVNDSTGVVGASGINVPATTFFKASYADGDITLSGAVRDGDLSGMTIEVDNANGKTTLKTLSAATSADWRHWTGLNTWTAGFTASTWVTTLPVDCTYHWKWPLSKDQFTNIISEGENTIIVTATDADGKETEATFRFTKDTAAPLVKYHNIEPVVIDKALWDAGGDALSTARGKMTSFEGAGSVIKGAFEDGNSLIGYGTEVPPGSPDGTPAKYYFDYRIYEKDILTNNTWSEINPTWTRVYFDTAPTNRSANWTITLGDRLDGTYLLDIRIADRSNNIETVNKIDSDPTKSNIVNYVAFAMDTKAPELSIEKINNVVIPAPSAPALSNIFKEPFTLSGQASDGNFHRLTVKVDDYKEEVFTYNGTVYNWSWTIMLNKTGDDGNYIAGFNDLPDGMHTVTITAYDTSGKSKSTAYAFVKDTTGPVITLNNINLSGSSITDVNAQIRVSFNDEYSNIGKEPPLTEGVATNYYFEYVIYPASASPTDVAAIKGNWEYGRLGAITGKSANFTISLTGTASEVPNHFWNGLNAIPDGNWVLEIKVADRLGTLTERISDNTTPVPNTAATVPFNVNRGGPVITVETEPHEKYGGTNAGPVYMKGTVRDGDFANMVITVTSGPANNPTTTVTVPTTPATLTPVANSGGLYNWEWTLPSGTFDNNDEVAQGINTITITATDATYSAGPPESGNKTVKTFDFTKDTVKPEAQFLNIKDVSINRTEWTNGDSKKKQIGSIEEPSDPQISGLFVDVTSSIADTFKYRIYGFAALSDADAPALSDSSWVPGTLDIGDLRTKKWTIDLGNSRPDGTYWLDLDVSDAFGNVYHKEKIAFALDRKPPELELEGPLENKENNVYKEPPLTMSIIASDGNLDYVKVMLNGTEVSQKPANGSTTIEWDWKWAIDSSAAFPDTDKPYSLVVTAYDLSGKTAFGQINFTVDLTAPTVSLISDLSATITDPNAAITGSFNDVYSRIGKETGTFTGGQMYFFEYYIAKTSAAVPDGAWKRIPLSANPSLSTSWTIPLTNVTDGIWPFNASSSTALKDLPDGSYYLTIRVYDRLGNGRVTTAAQFTVDRAAPVFIKANGNPGLDYSTATDNATFVDSNYGTALTLSGKVRDGNLNPSTLTMTISGGKLNGEVSSFTNTGTWDSDTGELPWTWTMSKTYFEDLDDAKYTITLNAKDNSNKNAVPVTYTFTKDVHPPRIEFSNINKVDISSSVWTNGNAPSADATAKKALQDKLDAMTVIQGNNPVINGTFEDDVSQIGASPKTFGGGSMYYFEYRIYGANELTSKPSSPMPGWTEQPLAAETQTNQPWTIPLYGTSLYPSGIPDGMYWLDIRVSDRVTHQETVSNIAFTVDRKAPDLSIRTPDPEAAKNQAFKAPFNLIGKIKDGNLRGIKIKVDESEEEEYAIPQPTPAPAGITVTGPGTDTLPSTDPQYIAGGDVYSWTWTIPTTTARVTGGPVWNSAFSDGPHTITVTAYDFAGRTTYKTYNFIKDTTRPTVTSGVDSGNSIITGTNAAIRVSLTDEYSNLGYGIENSNYYFEYRIYKNPASKPNFKKYYIGTAAEVGKSTTRDIALNTSSTNPEFWKGAEIPDGNYYLDVRVNDRVNNFNDTVSPYDTPQINEVPFTVDRKAPVLTVTPNSDLVGDYNATTQLKEPVFTLGISVVDGDLDDVKIIIGDKPEQSLGKGSYNDNNNTWTLPTWSISKSDFGTLPDGRNTITVTAYDEAGNTSNVWTRSFNKDLNPPDITINIDKTIITLWPVTDPVRKTITTLAGNNASLRGAFDDSVSRVGAEETTPLTIVNAQGQTVPNPNLGKFYYEYCIYTSNRLSSKPQMVKVYFAGNPNQVVNWEIPLTSANTDGFWTSQTGNIPDGYYWLDLRVADRTGNIATLYNVAFAVDSGNPILVVNPPLPVIEKSTFTLTGTANDLTFDHLTVTLDGGNANAGISSSSSFNPNTYIYTWSWTPPASFNLFNGSTENETTHTITITAHDELGNSSIPQQITFIVDTKAPEVAYNNLDEPIEDTNAALRGSISDDASSLGYTTGGVAPYYFKYRIRKAGTSAADTLPNWTNYNLSNTVGKSANWNISVSGTSAQNYWNGTDGISDGTWWLDIDITDRTGNAHVVSKEFTVDRFPPTLTVTGFTNNAIYGAQTSDVFGINMTAADVNLKELKVEVGSTEVFKHTWVGGTPPTTNGESISGELKQYTTPYSLPAASFPSVDGPYTVTITASDSANKDKKETFTFIRDTVKPTVEFQSIEISPVTTFESKTFKIQGVAEDLNGVYSVETKIEQSDRTGTWTVYTDNTGAVTDNFTMLRQATTVNGVKGSLGTSVNWTKQIIGMDQTGAVTDLKLPDGRYRITVRVTDRASPTSNSSLNGQKTADPAVVNEIPAVEFKVDTQMPSLNLNPTPQFVNGSNHLSGHPFFSDYAAQGSADGYPALPANLPANRGFYITGTTASTFVGMKEVVATLYDGSTAVGTPTKYSVPPANEFDPVIKWGILIPYASLDGSKPEGKTYTVNIDAVSSGTKVSSRSRDFTFDITAPFADVITPSLGLTITGNGYVVKGTSSDEVGVRKIEYIVGKDMMSGNVDNWADAKLAPNDTQDLNPLFTGGLYSWNVTLNILDTLGGYANATKAYPVTLGQTITENSSSNIWLVPFRIRVTDAAGNVYENRTATGSKPSFWSQPYYYLILDPDADIPTASFSYPDPNDPNKLYGGEVRVSGMAKDNDYVYAVMVRVLRVSDDGNTSTPVVVDGKTTSDGWAPASFTSPGEQVMWTYIINSNGELNSTTSEFQKLTVEIRPIDSKARETLDPKDFVPSTFNFNNFVKEQNRVGYVSSNTFTLSNAMPTIENVRVGRQGNTTVEYLPGHRTAGTFVITAEVRSPSALKTISLRSGSYTDNKYVDMLKNINDTTPDSNINDEGRMYSTGMPGTPITVNTTALDIGRKYMIATMGSTTEADWRAMGVEAKDNPAPWVAFVYNGGTRTGNGTVYAAQGAVIGSPYTVAKAWQQKFVYTLTVTLDSARRYPVNGTSTSPASGPLVVDIKADDLIPYSSTYSLNIQIDNYYPTGAYSAPRNASTSTYWVQGTAVDINNATANSGPYGDVAEVLAYFERGNVYYNPYGIDWNAAATTSKTNVMEVASNGTKNANVTINNYPNMNMSPPLGNTSSLPAGKVVPPGIGANIALYPAASIKKNEVSTDNDGNGYVELFSDKGGTITWGFQFETRNFSDGPLTLHYIIIDSAGNNTHYTQSLYIRNNPPVISAVTLKTDLNFSHNYETKTSPPYDQPLDATRRMAPASKAGYLTTNFNAKNYRLRFEIDTVTGSGNGTKTFRVSPVDRVRMDLAVTNLTPGEVYTITYAGNTDWVLAGAPAGTNFDPVGVTFVCTDPAVKLQDSVGDLRGEVWRYIAIKSKTDTTAGTSRAIEFGNRSNWAANGINTDADFRQATGFIQDSTTANGSLFLVKVYDSTVTTGNTAESNQQADVVLVGLNVMNVDTIRPTALINPFHWTSVTDNSLLDNSRSKGHIELETTTVVNPKVSGQISIRGTAVDNENIIGSLWVRMDSFTFPATPANTATINNQTYYQIANYTAGGGLQGMTGTTAGNWKCTISDEVIDQNGHRVNWQLDIDTSKVTGVAATGRVFRIIARDISENTQQDAGTQTTTANRTAYYNMDIVPYILSVTTRLSSAYSTVPSAFNRSAKGWYPVREDEVITIQGFNLYSSSYNNGNPSVQIRPQANSGSTAAGALYTTYTAGTAAATGLSQHTVNTVYARVDNDGTNNTTAASNNTITSGFLVVRVNDVDSINNTNNDEAGDKTVNGAFIPGYNREGNGLNNDKLTDDRALYVWNMGKMDLFFKSTYIYQPFMRMDKNGVRLLSYGFYSTYASAGGRLKVQRNNTEYIAGGGYSNRVLNTTIAVANTNVAAVGNTSWYAAGSDISSSNNRGFQFDVSANNGSSNPSDGTSSDGTGDTRQTNYTNSSPLTSVSGANMNRFKVPRIAVQSTNAAGTTVRGDTSADRILMSFYDDETNNDIRIIYGNVGSGNNIGNFPSNATAANMNFTPPTGSEEVATDATTHKGSIYTAAGLMSNGLPVVAWYDRVNQNLVISWGSGTPTSDTYNAANDASRVRTNLTGTNSWQGNAAIIATGSKGAHVDMAIDDEDNIHLAFYQINPVGLWYTRIAPTAAAGAARRPNITKSGNTATNVTLVRVDTYLSAGTKLMLNVRKEGGRNVPYITYHQASFPGSNNTIRVAWQLESGDNTDSENKFLGTWEVMSVPVGNDVTPSVDDFVCNGVPSGTNGSIPNGANGWEPPSGSTLRTYPTLNKSILVGYMTDKWYEGAILKRDLW